MYRVRAAERDELEPREQGQPRACRTEPGEGIDEPRPLDEVRRREHRQQHPTDEVRQRADRPRPLPDQARQADRLVDEQDREGRASVCPVTIHQRTEEVETTLIRLLQEEFLTPAILSMLLTEIRREVEKQMPHTEATIAEVEDELRTMRAEQKRLAKAIAIVDDAPELVAELQQRAARVRVLEAELAAAKRTPDEIAALMTRVEASALERTKDLRSTLTRGGDLREVFRALFPDGVRLLPDHDGTRQVWKIEARPDLGELAANCSKRLVTPTAHRRG